MKKLVIILILVAILVLGVILYIGKERNNSVEELNLVAEAVNVATEYSKIFSGGVDFSKIDRSKVSENVMEYINKAEQNIKQKENELIDIDKFFYEFSDDFGGEVIKEPNTYTVLQPIEGLEDDSRFIYIDNKPYLPLKDLDKEGYGQDSFNYNGVILKLDLEEEHETYTKIIKKLDNHFIYETYKEVKKNGKHSVNVVFKSIEGGRYLNIKLQIADGRVVEIEDLSNR